MLEAYLRPVYQKLFVTPIAERLTRAFRLSPNTITLWSGVLGVLVLPVLFAGHAYFAVMLLLLSGYCDTLDGTIARMTDRVTSRGGVFDIICDRVVEISVIFAIFNMAPFERGVYALGMMASVLLCVTSFLLVGIFTDNETEKSFHYSPGLIERAEAFVFFIAMILFPEAFKPLAVAFIVLVTYTAAFRVWEFVKQD